MESRNFLSFCFPSYVQLDDKNALNEWIERMIFIFDDLKWLLSLSVPKFWNQVCDSAIFPLIDKPMFFWN